MDKPGKLNLEPLIACSGYSLPGEGWDDIAERRFMTESVMTSNPEKRFET